MFRQYWISCTWWKRSFTICLPWLIIVECSFLSSLSLFLYTYTAILYIFVTFSFSFFATCSSKIMFTREILFLFFALSKIQWVQPVFTSTLSTINYSVFFFQTRLLLLTVVFTITTVQYKSVNPWCHMFIWRLHSKHVTILLE